MGTRHLHKLTLLALAGVASAWQAPQQAPRTVEERLAELEAKLSGMPRSTRAEWKDGFVLESGDGADQLRFAGLLQVVGAAYESDAARDNGFDLTRMRVAFEGRLQQRYLFTVENELEPTGSELAEAWIGFDLGPGLGRLMLGRMKEPFSLEEMVPRRHIDFVFFSSLNQFVPAEDHGVTWLGRTEGGALEYGLAAYNGSGGDELNDDKDAAARLVWHVFGDKPARDFPADELQFGVAATVGRADQDWSGVEIQNETKQSVFAFESGTELDGQRTRLGLEAAWFEGPFALYGEALRIEQELNAPGGRADLALDGFWVAGSWVVTGESKRFSGLEPSAPFLPGQAGAGAWQLVARYSELELDQGFVDIGAVQASAFPGRIATFDVGVNWYATNHAKVRAHIVHTRYEDGADIGGQALDDETALLLQYQLKF
ncbi:MAG: hypothetical protein IT454_17120 [Planctomycetes bacterium]|nr:hypothetical protein [Planctomycetota bacterium]